VTEECLPGAISVKELLGMGTRCREVPEKKDEADQFSGN
jgi:hypothetical protein